MYANLKRLSVIFAGIIILLLQSCAMMGMGMMASGRHMLPGDAGQETVFIDKVQPDGTGASLAVPSLRLDQSAVLTVQVYDTVSGSAISGAKVQLFIREGMSSSQPGELIPATSLDLLEPVRITGEGAIQFIYTPRIAGIAIIETRISYPPYGVDNVLALQARYVVEGISHSRDPMTRLTTTAIIGGLAMLAMMALFMWGGHGHGSI